MAFFCYHHLALSLSPIQSIQSCHDPTAKFPDFGPCRPRAQIFTDLFLPFSFFVSPNNVVPEGCLSNIVSIFPIIVCLGCLQRDRLAQKYVPPSSSIMPRDCCPQTTGCFVVRFVFCCL